MATPQVILPPMRRKPGPKPKMKPLEIPTPPAGDDGPSLHYFLHAPDSVLRDRYRSGLDKDEALRELARLRKISDIAGTEINQRLVPDERTCLICKTTLPEGRKVTMMINVKDDATGTISTHPLCSIECVKQWNKVKMGLAELVK